MSFIINNTSAFVSVKLTNLGRESLAKGQLSFNYFAIGDSEINYNREELVENNPLDSAYSATSKILRPADSQPDIKYFISTGTTVLNPMTLANIKTIKAVVNNEATERGFFSGSVGSFITLTGSTYVKAVGTVNESALSGGTTLAIGVSVSRSQGDFIMLEMTNALTGTITGNTNNIAVPRLWYQIKSTAGANITVDRSLPKSTSGGTSINYYIYPKGEVKDVFGSGSTTAYWDSGTLAFDSACDVSITDTPVWNMNNVWSENLAGITGATTVYEDYTKFGSYDYLGTKDPYFGFDLNATATSGTTNLCAGVAGFDTAHKAISILHYTNNTISNFYGEIFFIDNAQNKTVKVHLPDLMYHRRLVTGGSGSGTTMGMSFLASGDTNTLQYTDIEYVDLIEDPTLAITPVKTVGRVFPQLKVIVFYDEEIVAAMSYKSNRNWTLPNLNASLQTSVSGATAGVLAQNQTMYLTYVLANDTTSGYTTSLPCQNYTKVTNTTTTTKDVQFSIENTGLLPYMRKIESAWDGRGFYAYKFKLVYQIVANESDRPLAGAWKVADFTSTAITTVANQTINPIALENQNSTANGFILSSTINSGATTFNLNSILNMAPVSTPTNLQFGDERFFYGNIEAYIGATIYKTLFLVSVNSGQFNQTSNPTRSKDPATNPTNIRVSEVGIYDSNQNLVCIGKLSNAIELSVGKTANFELSMDF